MLICLTAGDLVASIRVMNLSPLNSFETKDGREVRGAETRADLRSAAELLIVEVGLEAVTAKAVAERAGVSRGAMLHHYPTRDDLVIDTARHFWQRAKEIVERQAIDLSAGRTDVAIFICVLYQNVFRANALMTMLDFMVCGRTDTRVGIAVRDILTDLFQAYEALGIKALSRSGISPEFARVTITLIMSTLRGLRIQNNIAPDDAKVKAVLDMLTVAVTHLLEKGAGAEPSGAPS